MTEYEPMSYDLVQGGKAMDNITGYQQGIIKAIGSMTGNRLSVRNQDRWYCDSVQPAFGTKVYRSNYGRGQWAIKSLRINPVDLGDVSDTVGFCRAYIEIHGLLDLAKMGKYHTRRPRLRIYGGEDTLSFIMGNLPVNEKKIQHINLHSTYKS